MQTLGKFWEETMQIPEARWIIWGTLLLFALMVAIYVSFYFRDLAVGNSNEESKELLGDLRRMKDEGLLNEVEYSRAKTQVTEYKGATSKRDAHSKPRVTEQKTILTLAEAQRQKAARANEEFEDQDEVKESDQESTE